jgi:hypothetical protein
MSRPVLAKLHTQTSTNKFVFAHNSSTNHILWIKLKICTFVVLKVLSHEMDLAFDDMYGQFKA